MERSTRHHRGGNEYNKQQLRQPGTTATSRGHGPPPEYFSVQLALVFFFVAASLAFLPLVLPPLSPPPFLLLLVPVCLLAVLVALAFVPVDAQSHLVGSSRS
jgi:hypothetical protein